MFALESPRPRLQELSTRQLSILALQPGDTHLSGQSLYSFPGPGHSDSCLCISSAFGSPCLCSLVISGARFPSPSRKQLLRRHRICLAYLLQLLCAEHMLSAARAAQRAGRVLEGPRTLGSDARREGDLDQSEKGSVPGKRWFSCRTGNPKCAVMLPELLVI